MIGKIVPGGRDLRRAKAMNEGDHQIAYCRHHLGSIARVETRAVFPEVYIAHIVESILDVPMTTVHLEQSLRGRLLRRQVGDEVENFLGGFALAGDSAGHLCHLLEMRPPDREVGGQLRADLDLAHFDAATVAIGRRSLHVSCQRIGKIGLQVRPQRGFILLDGQDTSTASRK